MMVKRIRNDHDRCTKRNIPKESIEAAVIEIISDYVWNEELIQEYIAAAEEADSKAVVNSVHQENRHHFGGVCFALRSARTRRRGGTEESSGGALG